MILDKKITKSIIPLIGTIIIICGYLKLSIYYKHFNIRINEYLDFTEILTLFLPDALYYGGLMFGVFMFNFLFKTKSEMKNFENTHLSIDDNSSVFDRIKKYYSIMKEFFWLIGFLILFELITFIWFKQKFTETIGFALNLSAGFFFVLLLFEIRHKYIKVYEKDINATYYNLFLIVFLFGFIVVGSVKSEIKMTETNPDFISFTYGGNRIESNKKLIYIGQTKNYLFLFDAKNKKAEIFERNKLSNYKITIANR